MYFKFGQYELEIDVERTRKFYETAEKVSDGCKCAGCRNYEKAVGRFDREIIEFFGSLGIDPTKITEAIAWISNPDKTVYYGVFYHVCGTLLRGESAWQEYSSTEKAACFGYIAENAYSITENYAVSFEDGVLLLEEDFPLPVLQIEISANIPWVLDEECPY